MDFFEVLIILALFVAPLIEGVLRKRKDSGEGAEGPDLPGGLGSDDASSPGRDRSDAPAWQGSDGTETEREPVAAGPAADMVPDDLWEVLTGERRQSGSRGDTASREEAAPAWSQETVAVEEPDALGEMAEADWLEAEVGASELGEPDSQEETPRIVSLEQPLPDPEQRHREFHEKMESLIEATSIGSERRPDRAAPLRNALGTASGVRQAVLLSEVLGPPVSMREGDTA
ncbi:MAG TPA: hypothetical protein VK966_05635 [Longimicrobiales bacterium]|nr:hypothetical protein [Longimicrobiales bacterium]